MLTLFVSYHDPIFTRYFKNYCIILMVVAVHTYAIFHHITPHVVLYARVTEAEQLVRHVHARRGDPVGGAAHPRPAPARGAG